MVTFWVHKVQQLHPLLGLSKSGTMMWKGKVTKADAIDVIESRIEEFHSLHIITWKHPGLIVCKTRKSILPEDEIHIAGRWNPYCWKLANPYYWKKMVRGWVGLCSWEAFGPALIPELGILSNIFPKLHLFARPLPPICTLTDPNILNQHWLQFQYFTSGFCFNVYFSIAYL